MFFRRSMLCACLLMLSSLVYFVTAIAQSAAVTQISLTNQTVLFAISPDSKLLAVAANGNLTTNQVDQANLPIQVFNLNTGTQIGQYTGNTDYAGALAFSPDSKTLMTYHTNGILFLWDTTTGSLIKSFTTGIPSLAGALQTLSDGKQIVIGKFGNVPMIEQWDTATQTMTQFLSEPYDSFAQYNYLMTGNGIRTDGVTGMKLSPDSTMLAVGTSTDDLWLWNLVDSSGKLLIDSGLDYPYSDIRQITFTNDSRIFYFSHHDHQVHFWDTTTSTELTPFELAGAEAAAISPDGKTIVWIGGMREGVTFQSFDDPDAHSAILVPIPGGAPFGPNMMFTPDGQNVVVSGIVSSNGQDHIDIDVVRVPQALPPTLTS